MRRASGSALLLLVAFVAGVALVGRLATPAPLTGSVVDARGPVAGARVRVQGKCQWAVTDDAGRFRLPGPAGRRRVTAWKAGHGIAAAPAARHPLQITLLPLPTIDNDAYEWVDPAPNPARPNHCGNCHAEIHREWSASAHAAGATNRRFLNLFAGTDWDGKPATEWSLLAQRPDGAGVCAACHAPTFTDPTLDYDLRRVEGVAARGVHCDYCHKIADAPTDRLGTRFGRDGLRLLRPPNGEQLFFGPLDDAHREGETFAYAPLYRESRYCASCHEGVVFGVHAYGTYSEWLDSPARRQGQQCQHCHMAPTRALTNVAPGRGGVERAPWTLASHRFPGGQVDMLRRCLTLTATASPIVAGVRLEVEVRADHVGHRVPTGFSDRNLVLLVEGFDGSGNAVRLLNGATLPDSAGTAIAGWAGRLYAKQLKGADGRGPVPFWVAHDDAEDTRLFPGRPEARHFTFAPGAARFRVRLLYRRFWPAVAESRGWPANEILVLERTVQPRAP